MVGHRFVEALRRRDTEGAWRVVVLAEERAPAYDRVALSSYVERARARTSSRSPTRVPRRRARRPPPRRAASRPSTASARPWSPPRAGRRRLRRARARHRLRAVRAAGAGPRPRRRASSTARSTTSTRCATPPRPPRRRPGAGRRSGVVVGGGLLGLEAANALRAARALPARRGDRAAADAGAGRRGRRGAAARASSPSSGCASTPGSRRAPSRATTAAGSPSTLSDGTELDASVVVFSAGIRPADSLAREIGLDGGRARRGARRRAAAAPPTSTCGPSARSRPSVDGGGPHLRARRARLRDGRGGGRPAASAATRRFTEADMSTKLKLLGVDVASFGDAHAATPGALEVTLNDPVAGTYSKLVVSDDASTLLGGILVGDASNYETLRGFVGETLPGDPMSLIAPGGRRCRGVGIDALPDGAQICSCNAVTKGALVEAITAGDASTCPSSRRAPGPAPPAGPASRRSRRSSPSCGVEVSKALCEHFDHSRAELSRSSMATGLTTFSEIVDAARPRPGLRHLQARRRVDPGHDSRAGTSSTASRPRCRTPTTTSWPTCSATAPTRWCRGCPAARSRPRG